MKITKYLLIFFALILSCGVFLPIGVVHAGDNITIQFSDDYGENFETAAPPDNAVWTLYYNGTFPPEFPGIPSDYWKIALNNIPSFVKENYQDIWIKLVYPGSQWNGIGSNWQTLAANVATSLLNSNSDGTSSFDLLGTLSLTGCGNTANDVMVQAYWAVGTKIGTPVDGTCNPAEKCLSAAPTGATNLCNSGAGVNTTVSTTFSNGTYYWACPGSNGGGTAYCSASLTARKCGSAGDDNTTPDSKYATASPPIKNLCAQGKAGSPTNSTGPWAWTCTDSCGGIDCYAPASGLCSSANKATITSVPSNDSLCTYGTASPATPSYDSSALTWNWTCAGSPGGATDNCTSYLKATCGTAANTHPQSAPTTNLCIPPESLVAPPGVAQYHSGSNYWNQWTWTCKGSSPNKNTTVTCDTAPPLNGRCGPAATTYYQ